MMTRCLTFASRVFLSAPIGAQDMPLSQVLIDAKGWELVSEGRGFTEGPAVGADGNLFCTDVRQSKIYKADAEGNVTLFVENSARTNSLIQPKRSYEGTFSKSQLSDIRADIINRFQ